MGIVLSAFITTTCSKLLLWFVLLLMPRLRLRPIQLFSMELTAMLVMLPHTLTAMLMLSTDTTDMPDLMLTVLDTEATDMDTHMPMVVFTERDPLMLSQRPRLMLLSSTEPTDTDSDTPDTLPMVLTHMPTELTHMPMVLTTERDPLMPSQRLMPMLTTDTTDMPDLMLMVLDTPDTDMDTHMVMDMPGESKLFQPKVLSYCKPKAQ